MISHYEPVKLRSYGIYFSSYLLIRDPKWVLYRYVRGVSLLWARFRVSLTGQGYGGALQSKIDDLALRLREC